MSYMHKGFSKVSPLIKTLCFKTFKPTIRHAFRKTNQLKTDEESKNSGYTMK